MPKILTPKKKKMPPFAGAAAFSADYCDEQRKPSPSPQIVTLNVGGQRFQTTAETLALAGPRSLLASPPPFIDRDPHLFSLLLSLLRSHRRPPQLSHDLIAEARFYGLADDLIAANAQFDAFALRPSLSLPINGRDFPSALAAAPSGEILVAHGGKITSFDSSLNRRSTILTPLPAIDSLLPVSHLAFAGAADFPALHVLDLRRRSLISTLDYRQSTVQAVANSSSTLFASFESCRRTSSAIVAFDIPTLKPIAEIGRKEIFGAELDSAIPATKLQWVPNLNLLMAAGSHNAPSGLHGDIRLWDVRSGTTAFDLREESDCFADVTVSDSLSAMFKIGAGSGEVYMMDLRMLGAEDPWVCLGRRAAVIGGRKEGIGCRIESHEGSVFRSRGGEVEMWTEVAVKGSSTARVEDGLEGERVMRRNLMGTAKDSSRRESKITQMVFGGNRMVLARKEEHCVEVWESSARG